MVQREEIRSERKVAKRFDDEGGPGGLHYQKGPDGPG